MIKLFQITEHIKYLRNFKYLKGMEVSWRRLQSVLFRGQWTLKTMLKQQSKH